MVRVINTENDEHAGRTAKALLGAAGDDKSIVRVVSGTNGRLGFEVDDDFPAVAAVPVEPPLDEPAQEPAGDETPPKPKKPSKKATPATPAE